MNLSDIDVLILAGGQGSRIRHLLPEGMPKCLADINGEPFLVILLKHLSRLLPCARFHIACGYGAAWIEDYFLNKDIVSELLYCNPLAFATESEPRGTGGTIVEYGLGSIRTDPFFVINGDTYCDINLSDVLLSHRVIGYPITVPYDSHYRNLGIYLFEKRVIKFAQEKLGPKWDIDQGFTVWPKASINTNWYPSDAPYYDIGSPEGLEQFRALWKKHDINYRAD